MKRLLTLMTLLATLVTATSLTWNMVGPGAGGAFNMMMDTPNGVLLLGGDVGGLFRSPDLGQNWLHIGKLNSAALVTGGSAATLYGNSTIYDRTNVSAFGIHPQPTGVDSPIVYMGIEGGILRSVDGGRSFGARTCDSTSGTDWIASIAPCRWHPDTVLVAWHSGFGDSTRGCIRMSTNYGRDNALWARVPMGASTGFPTQGLRLLKVGCKPNNASFMYALSGTDGLITNNTNPLYSSLYRSRDGGATWDDITPGSRALDGDGAWDFLIHPYNPDTIFCTTWSGNISAGTYTGKTWVKVHQDSAFRPISAHTGSLAFSARGPTLEPAIYTIDVKRDYTTSGTCAECGVWKATAATQQNAPPVSNGPFSRIETGANWNWGWNFMDGSHGDFAHSDSERGVANTIFTSAYDSTHFYWTTSLYAFKADTTGRFAPVYTDFKRAGPNTLGLANPSDSYWKGRAVGNTIPMALSAGGGVVAAGWFDLGIGVSRDGGLTWQMANDSATTLGAGGWFGHGGDCPAILVDPNKPSTIWAAQGTGKTAQKIIRSTQYGQPGTWTTVMSTNGFVTDIELDPTSAVGNRTLFAISNGDYYRSTDDGQNWSLVWDRASGTNDSCFRVVAARGQNVWIGGPGGLWYSSTGGATSGSFAYQFPMPSGWTVPSTVGAATDMRYVGVHDIVARKGETFVCITGSTSTTDPVYVNTATPPDSFGVYRSADNGTTWTKLKGMSYADHFNTSVDGSWWITSRIATSGGGFGNGTGEGIFRSFNKGRTWTQVGNNGLAWPAAQSIVTDPMNGEWVIVNSLGSGVYRASLPGVAFVPKRRAR